MSEQPIFSVSEFVQTLKVHLGRLGQVVVEGEVSGYRVSKEKLVYFELKDESSRILCFMMVWDLDVDLQDGLSVRVTSVPSLFTGSGGLHLRVSQVELVGQGALQQALEKTKKKLEAEGLFAPERKRALLEFPERIGLMTSPDAAARTDVLRVLKNRWPFARVVFFPVGVQGTGAIAQIVGALERCGKYQLDAVILTRGGGSLEDLQAFNSERVARAIFSCAVPVVSGIGHERDWTIADLVADVRAATPSNAAEIVSPDAEHVHARIGQLVADVEDGWRQALGEAHDRLHHLTRDLTSSVQSTAQRVQHLGGRLVRTYVAALQRVRANIQHAGKLVQTLSPVATLERGYSLTMVDGRVATDARAVAKGSRLQTRLKRGTLRSTVD